MAKRWVTRWGPTQPGEKGSFIEVLAIRGKSSIEAMDWELPPSKSHAIRMLALAAQSPQSTVLHNMAFAGQDVVSMRRCLRQLGVSFDDLDASGNVLPLVANRDDQPHEDSLSWRVHGVGPGGLQPPTSVLHAGNSGTALRILMALAAQFSVPVMLDGDASLRSRSYANLLSSLQDAGVSVSYGTEHERLPVLLQGPKAANADVTLDVSSSSQPSTAWYLATPSLQTAIRLNEQGQAVSRRHSELTRLLCMASGAPSIGEGELVPWVPTFSPSSLEVPPDCSMLAFAFLAARVHGCQVALAQWPREEDALGHELLFEHASSLGARVEGNLLVPLEAPLQEIELDLRDANDLITPLAALMALGGGGTITGAAHAAHKETNRLSGTERFLAQFGLQSQATPEGLVLSGGQRLEAPKGMVETYGDHRMQLTALVLASSLPSTTLLTGPSLHGIADPGAVERWRACGVEVESRLHATW